MVPTADAVWVLQEATIPYSEKKGVKNASRAVIRVLYYVSTSNVARYLGDSRFGDTHRAYLSDRRGRLRNHIEYTCNSMVSSWSTTG